MNRRTFLASLLAAAVLDPEKLLWVPRKKTFFIPPVGRLVLSETFQPGDVVTFAGRYEFDPRTRESTGKLQRFIIGPTVKGNHGLIVLPFHHAID